MFFLKFLLTNIAFSIIIFSILAKLNKGTFPSNRELFIYSFGLGPPITTLFLFYLLSVFPNFSYKFYLLVTFTFYSILLYLGKGKINTYFQGLFTRRRVLTSGKSATSYEHGFFDFRTGKIIYFSVYSTLFILLFVLYYHAMQNPIEGYDVLQYSAQGKNIYLTRKIEPRKFILNPDTGFSRPSLHAPGFSLLLTWEYLLGSPFSRLDDLFFKSIPIYYGFLILMIQIYWLRKYSRWLAMIGSAALLSSLIFYENLFLFHIDTYRIFFVSVSLIYLYYSIQYRTVISFLLFGIFSGLAGFSHSLGAMISFFAIGTFFLFVEGGFYYRLKWSLVILSVACLFGDAYYLQDMLWGTGWIFGSSLF